MLSTLATSPLYCNRLGNHSLFLCSIMASVLVCVCVCSCVFRRGRYHLGLSTCCYGMATVALPGLLATVALKVLMSASTLSALKKALVHKAL